MELIFLYITRTFRFKIKLYLIYESPKMVSWESIPHLIFFMENRPSLSSTHPSSNLFRSWWLWSTKIEFSVQSRQFSPPASFYAGIYLLTGERISGATIPISCLDLWRKKVWMILYWKLASNDFYSVIEFRPQFN